MKTIEKAATKSRAKAKHADSPTTNSVRNELVEGRRAKLGELFKVIGGGTPTTQVSDYWIGNIPWISSADIDDEHRVSARKCISPAALKASTTNLVPANSVIVVTRVGLGKVAIAPTDMCFSQDCQALLFSDKEADPRFVLHQLGLATQIFRYISRGTTIPGVTKKQLLDLDFWLPPLSTQHRIVAEIEEKLSRLDAAQSALVRAQANLKRYRASVLAEAVTDQSKKFPRATINDLSSEVKYGSSSKTNVELTDGVPVLRMGNIENGALVLDKLKYLPGDHDEFPTLLLSPGDLLFNRTNSPELVGKCAVFKGTPEICSFASYLIKVRFNDRMLADFASYYINSVVGRAWIAEVVSQQVGQANVNGSKLKALEIPVPPIKVQHRIVADVERRLSVIDRTEQTLRTQLERAKRLRQSILQQAFSPTRQDA